MSGSSALPKKVFEWLETTTGARITPGFGATELSTTGLYCYAGQKMWDSGMLGFVNPFCTAQLIDASDCSEFKLDVDQVGEMIYTGPGIAAGYVDGGWP